MLTIIAFLYSLPKYTLPDNRVQFYELCTRALLEEWDRAQDVQRANRFEAHQKLAVLDRVAFEHISRAAQTDELVAQDRVFRLTREEMKALSLKVEEYSEMVTEIVQNSGLLQFIPPRDYRFPHRTFMEFFAADYLATQKTAMDVLELFEPDPERWRQTLLLYMGCNKNQEYANTILHYLKDLAVTGRELSGRPVRLLREAVPDGELAGKPMHLLVFEALTECAVPDPALASEILELAGQFLTGEAPSPEIIEQLGYIGGNPRWAHAQQAKDVLLGLLDQSLPEDSYQQVIFALLHARDPRINDIIARNLRNLDWTRFFSALTTDATPFVHRLLSLDLTTEEKRRVVAGLRAAGNLGILAALLAESLDPQVQELAALALFGMSKVEGFELALDETGIASMPPETRQQVERAYAEWGWRWDEPQTESGKKLAVLACLLTAGALFRDREALGAISLEETDNRFRFLTTGFLVEGGVAFHRFNLIEHREAPRRAASLGGLQRYWQGRFNVNSFHYRLLEAISDTTFIAALLLWPLVCLGGLTGLVFRLAGWTSTPFYTYLYDDFTIAYLMFGWLIWALGTFLFRWFADIQGSEASSAVTYLILSLLFGPIGLFVALGQAKSPLGTIAAGLACIALGLAQWLLPFQSVIWSAFLCVYFLRFGLGFLGDYRLEWMNFASADQKQVIQFLAREGEWLYVPPGAARGEAQPVDERR